MICPPSEAVRKPAPQKTADQRARELPSYQVFGIDGLDTPDVLQIGCLPSGKRLVGEEIHSDHQRDAQREAAEGRCEKLRDW